MIINTNGVNTSIYPQLVINATVGTVIKVSKGPHIINVTTENEITIIDVPEYGTWTVTGSINGVTLEETIEVDTVKQYELTIVEYDQIVNYTMIYDEGDECTDVIGGWSKDGYSRSGYALSAGTKKENCMSFSGVGSNKGQLLGTVNGIDITDYVKFMSNGKSTGNYSTANLEISHIPNSKNLDNGSWITDYVSSTDKGIKLGDLTDKNGIYYFALFSGSISSRGGEIYHMALLKADNWQKWTEIGNITGFTDLNALVNDSSSMTALMSNRTAVRYMVKQMTGDAMLAILNSEIAMSALNNSPYKSLVQANEHWAKFLAMVA